MMVVRFLQQTVLLYISVGLPKPGTCADGNCTCPTPQIQESLQQNKTPPALKRSLGIMSLSGTAFFLLVLIVYLTWVMCLPDQQKLRRDTLLMAEDVLYVDEYGHITRKFSTMSAEQLRLQGMGRLGQEIK